MKLLMSLSLSLAFSLHASENSLLDWIDIDNIKTSDLETVYDLEYKTEVYGLTPQEPNGESIIMVPGHGLSHSIYMSTPDGRLSWAEFFRDQGYQVYIINPSQNIAPRSRPPQSISYSTWDVRRIWSRWGFGPSFGSAYPNSRFPTINIEAFAELMPLHSRQTNGGSQTEAIAEVLKTSGPSHLVVHSASGSAGFSISQWDNSNLLSLIAVEPVGCPTKTSETPSVPFLVIYGDYITPRRQTGRYESCQTTVRNSQRFYPESAFLDFPALGVYGNSHLMMQDNNNIEIAQNILDWINP